MRKRVYEQMRTAKAQISLRIRAVWSGPLLSANRIIGYYRVYEWRAKAQMILCACARWSEPALFAHPRRHLFTWNGPYVSKYLDTFTFLSYLPWILNQSTNISEDTQEIKSTLLVRLNTAGWVANSVAADLPPRPVAFDPGFHCFLRPVCPNT